MTIIKEERIGGQRLILGDCMEVMPLLGQFDAVVACCDAVVYTDEHGKAANWEPETPARGGVDMGRTQIGNTGALRGGAAIASRTGGALRSVPAGSCEGAKADWDTAEVEGAIWGAERALHRRDAKHDIPQNGGENALQQVLVKRPVACSSCGRGPHQQRGRKFGSPVLSVPFKLSQKGVVGIPEGWSILTDPPYGIGAHSGTGKYGRLRGYSGDWDASAPDVSWIAECNAPAIVWGGNYFDLPPSRAFLIWDKGAGFKGRDFAECEMAWCSFDANARMLSYDPLARGDYRGGNKQHPTQKPIALMQWCLGFLPDALTILDPFMGSGTTLVACQKLGRQGTGIELDPEYWRIACERVHKAWQEPDMFVQEAAPPEQSRMEI